MTFTRTFCPLPDCGWRHDQADFDPSGPQPFATTPPPEGTDPLVWGFLLGGTLVVENALRAHLETHELIEWVRALTETQRRAEKAEATIARVRQEHTLGPRSRTCNGCGEYWPCSTIQALDGVAAPATQASGPRTCPPWCSETHLYDGGCQLDPTVFPDETGALAVDRSKTQPWVWRCWGTEHCDGWLSFDHNSAAEARRSYDRHCKREHQAGEKR